MAMATKKRPSRERTIAAGKFKNECLRLLDQVARDRRPLVVTKRGKPIAKLVPMEAALADPFGCMRGTVTILGDIISPIDIEWEAMK
jgi:prevent-host-death family protein